VLHDGWTIRRGWMTTVHAYTNDQQILDLPHKDLRRARAAALNQIPTSTGAARSIGLVIPELKGKLDGLAIRVPVPDGSVVDLVAELGRSATREEMNAAFRKAAEGPLRGILQFSEEELVSSDIVRNPHSSVYDSRMSSVMDGTLVKILAWYDNEWGFSNRVVDLLQLLRTRG
jgi:glyceraldehyde 3-phosphate dehydrogenase